VNWALYVANQLEKLFLLQFSAAILFLHSYANPAL